MPSEVCLQNAQNFRTENQTQSTAEATDLTTVVNILSEAANELEINSEVIFREETSDWTNDSEGGDSEEGDN